MSPQAVDDAFRRLDNLNRQDGWYSIQNLQINMSQTLEGELLDLLGLNYKALTSNSLFQNLLGAEELTQEDVDRYYLDSPQNGISAIFSSNLNLVAMKLYSEGHEGYQEYSREIPGGLSFKMSRTQVRSLLGKPTRVGEGGKVPFLGYKPPWDKYLYANASLHCQYSKELDRILVITVSTPETSN